MSKPTKLQFLVVIYFFMNKS